jgi:putative spermidine/putrescine transport system substrate-binding protein
MTNLVHATTAISRRSVLGAGAAAAVGSAVIGAPFVARAKVDGLVVASSGGKLEEAMTAAIYKPFTAKTGTQIVSATNTYAKLKAMVEAKSIEWDVAQVDSAAAAGFTLQGLVEPLDYSVIDKSDFLPGVPRENYLPWDVVACVISWNTKNVKKGAVPQSWAELWDLKRFAGQRGFWKQPFQTMELALMADGVAKDKLYPIDVERALKTLDKIKPQIFWWTSGAQSAQILIDGEIAAGMSWNGRIHDPKNDGAPVDFHFNESLYVSDAWIIPKGAKNKKEAMEFIAFAMQPEQQAAFATAIPYGPVNAKALKLIDAKRLPALASSEENFKKGVFQDFDWWAQNGPKTGERFNSWLLG